MDFFSIELKPHMVTDVVVLFSISQGVNPHFADADLHQVIAAHRFDNINLTRDPFAIVCRDDADIFGPDT